MAVKLNGRAYSHAQELIERGDIVNDEEDCGASISPPRSRRTDSSNSTASPSMASGIWALTPSRAKTTRVTTSFPMVISKKYTDAESSPPNRERDSISTRRSRARQHTCTACSMRWHATPR
jgi:hypothetical protein